MRYKAFFSVIALIIVSIQGCATNTMSKEEPSISTSLPNIPIPRSTSKDKAKYYLLQNKKDGNIARALHKRVDGNHISFTLTQTDCATRQMRVLSHSDKSQAAMKEKPGKWFALVPGSSSSDIANFVCTL